MQGKAGEEQVAAIQNASTSKEVVAAVLKAIESPSVFFYGALLHALQTRSQNENPKTPNSEEVDNWMQIVELLAFKTVAEVDGASATVKTLLASHPIIQEKLRVLSFLTLCAQHRMTVHGLLLPYDVVQRATGVSSGLEVQKVVLMAVQQGLCTARLNEQTATVRVFSYESRNVQAGEVAGLQARLAEWTAYAEKQLLDIQ